MTEEEIEKRLRASLTDAEDEPKPREPQSGIKNAVPSDDEIVKKLAADMNAGIEKAAAAPKRSNDERSGAGERHHHHANRSSSEKCDVITSKKETVTSNNAVPDESVLSAKPNTRDVNKVESEKKADETDKTQKKSRDDGKKCEKLSPLKILRDGVIDNNPVFVQLLGMCSTLATTTSVKNALGMGLATSAVLICSNIMISLLRRVIPKEVRIAAYVVIISGFVTAVELLMKAYVYDLYEALGLFIPLIVVNCIILARAEAFASKNGVLASALDGIATGAGYTLALFLTASVREILGAGSWMGIDILGSGYSPAVIFVLPAGAFLTIGFLLAAVQKIRNNSEDRARMRRLSDISVNTKGSPADEPNK